MFRCSSFRCVRVRQGLVALALLVSGSVAFSGQVGYVENDSYDTLCAEVDNIDIPIIYTNASAYRIVAMNPRYNPTSISAWAADWDSCTFSDDSITWSIGYNDGLSTEFATSGFSATNEYYALDNPPAGIDQPFSSFPREINNDWMYCQDIVFTADQAGDANIEVLIGAVFTVKLAAISGTLEIKALTRSTNGWTDQGNRVFSSTNMTAVWNIPDLTWMVGTDTNVLRLQVVRAGDGGATTAGSWAYYDYLELSKRNGLGDDSANPTVLYSDGNTKVETVWIDFWWRHPRAMTVTAIGGNTDTNAQYLRIKRRMPNSSDWNEIFVLYEDGNARIIPLPPTNLGAVPYGASVILGPSTNSPRPCVGIDSVTVDPTNLFLDINYQAGGQAHVQLRADRSAQVVDVSGVTYATTNAALTRFRSMWVTDGKSDIDRVQNRDGTFAIMKNWGRLDGPWWAFFKEVPSYHNTYCPEFRVEIMDTNISFLVREAESADGGSGYVVNPRDNASGGQTIGMSTNGGEAVYDITLDQPELATVLHLRYSDLDGGNGIDVLGNTISVIVDGVYTVQTYSVGTGSWTNFAVAPSLALGDLAAGSHEIRIQTSAGTSGIELDRFDLVSEATKSWVKKTVLTRQCENWTWNTNGTFCYRGNAVGGQSVHLENTGLPPAVGYNVSIPTNYSQAYMRVRYSDDVGPNMVQIFVDNQLRAKFPSESTGGWDSFRDAYPIFLGALTSGTHEVKFTASQETWGVDLDEFEIYSYDNHPPAINLAGVYTVPVGATTSFVVAVSDADSDTVAVVNTAAPTNATFAAGTFTWTATVGDENTTNTIVFVADDQRGMTNSVVTNRADIVVPIDWNGDGIPDGWEWTQFGTLTNSPDADNDGDGFSNYREYIAGTEPTNANSVFRQDLSAFDPRATSHLITASTEPGRKYTMYFTDDALSNGVLWSTFGNTNVGFGTWIETNTVSTTHIFVDDEGPDTTGRTPSNGYRFYRVKVELP